MFNFFNSKKSVQILIFFWIFSAIYAYFFFPPKNDDATYMMIALSVFDNGIPGVLLNNEIIPTFFIFPTQPFINGIFLKIINFFGFDINSYNYRILNIISFVGLIIVTSRVINLLLKDHEYKYFLNSIFLILISITPFSHNFYINRPEIMGLFFIFWALYFIFLPKKKGPSKENDYIKISILLGLSFIMHPSCSLLSMAIYSVFLFNKLRDKNYKKIFMSIFFFILSISPLFIWIIINYDVASDQLFNRISNDTTGQINNIFGIFSLILKMTFNIENKSIFQNLYNFIFNFSLLLIIFSCVILNAIFLFKKKLKFNFISYEFSFFLIPLIIIMSMKPAPVWICVISFLLTFNLIILISKLKFEFLVNKKVNILLSVFLIFCFFAPLNPIFLHKIKNFITEDYFDVSKTKEFYNSIKNSNNILIINNKLLPVFIDEVKKEIKEKRIIKNLYWFYPILDRPSESFTYLYNLEIEQLLKNDHKNLIWGIHKKRINKINTNDYCLLTYSDKSIRLKNVQKIFEDRYHYFLKANKIINESCN